MKLRSLVTALFMLAIALGAARADDPPLEVQIVDAQKASGVHLVFAPTMRRHRDRRHIKAAPWARHR